MCVYVCVEGLLDMLRLLDPMNATVAEQGLIAVGALASLDADYFKTTYYKWMAVTGSWL